MAIHSSELTLAAWVLSAHTIPVGDEPYADRLLREFSWRQFRGRGAALLWKTMAELRAEGQRVEPGIVADRLGPDLAEIGDLADLWDLIRIERLPSTAVLTELVVPAIRESMRRQARRRAV
jgi:hypothetical protein